MRQASPSSPSRSGGGQKNTIRIIGGQWRRSLLRFPDAQGLRPTPDRVRETLFNWLGQNLSGKHCLDLFAGTGALGLEAASRGAARVVLNEINPRVSAALESHCDRLSGARSCVEIFRGDALEFAARLGRKTAAEFDLLLLDPPYHLAWPARIAPYLGGLLKSNGLLYVEAEAYLPGLGNWKTMKHGKAGQVFYHLMQNEFVVPVSDGDEN